MSNTVVNTNVLAINSHRSLKAVGGDQAKASAKLSSGLRINSAADDAAGLAISEKMRGQIRGLDQASRNAQDGISLIQTAEGGLQEIQNMAQRIRELAVQMVNDTNTTSDRAAADSEVQDLIAEMGRLGSSTKFNTQELYGNTFTFQVGADKGQTLTVDIGAVTTISGSVTDAAAAASLIDLAQTSIDGISTSRSKLGAAQNRLEYTIKSLDISSENLSASESRIRDTDMAKEMMKLTRSNVLQQASTSMLAQANQAPQNILQLLR